MKQKDESRRQEIREMRFDIAMLKIDKNALVFVIVILFIGLLVLACYFSIVYNDLQDEIDALPHKVCHNETYWQNYTVLPMQQTIPERLIGIPMQPQGYLNEFFCEGGVDFSPIEIFNYQTKPSKCYFKQVREICIIK